MNIDNQKIRTQQIRWVLLLALNNARPYGANEAVLLATVQAVYRDATQLEVRKELDYLDQDSRDLVIVKKRPDGVWHAELGRYGVDLVEYNVDCDPGIARPEKYW